MFILLGGPASLLLHCGKEKTAIAWDIAPSGVKLKLKMNFKLLITKFEAGG